MQPVVAQAVADPNAQLSAADTAVLQQKVSDLTTSCLQK